MEQNRRRFLRKVPTDPAFIQIERDEVGKVLNVSEGGLSFSSVTPVPRNLPVYFWFSFNLKDRIEAMGEVAWTDLSRTVGGLRFTQLSQGSREQIQKWLSRLRTAEAASGEFTTQFCSYLQPQAGFADATRASQGEQPHIVTAQQLCCHRHFLPTANKGGELDRQIAGCCSLRCSGLPRRQD